MRLEGSRRPLLSRAWAEHLFHALAVLALFFAIAVLVTLLADIFIDGAPRLGWDFLTNYPSRFADRAGILPALTGSFLLILLTALIAFPVGIAAAVYLEEYAPRNRLTQIIELNIANLAGVPSIIYGLLGLQLFIRYFGFGRSLIAGALTMALLVLPVIIITARESLRTVPKSLREASIALGATQWQTVRHHVIPVAFPGILTGCILASSRAIGETAPLITIGALTYVAFLPDSIFSSFTALPIQSFNWISRPQAAFHANAAAAITVLLVVLLTLNAVAIWLRAYLEKKYKLSRL